MIVILATLATLTLVAFNRTQADARNDSAKAKTDAISEALERYHLQNGEYPTCVQLTQSTSAKATAASVFNGLGLDPATLTRASSTEDTNSLDCSATASTTKFSYVGNGTSFTLSYKEDFSGNVVTIKSRQ